MTVVNNEGNRATWLADEAEAHHELIGVDIADFRQEVLLVRRTTPPDIGSHIVYQGERVRLLQQDQAARAIGQGVLFTKGEGGERWQGY